MKKLLATTMTIAIVLMTSALGVPTASAGTNAKCFSVGRSWWMTHGRAPVKGQLITLKGTLTYTHDPPRQYFTDSDPNHDRVGDVDTPNGPFLESDSLYLKFAKPIQAAEDGALDCESWKELAIVNPEKLSRATEGTTVTVSARLGAFAAEGVWPYIYIEVVKQIGGNNSSAACFDRHYDAAHLANHPDQLVTSMTLELDTVTDPVARKQWSFGFKIAMTKRGDNKLYVQEGDVMNRNGEYRGIVECDGGGFILQKIPSGALFSLGLGTGSADYIRMVVVPDPCGESEQINNSVDIERGKDDHTFRLDTQSTQVCSRLFDKIDWDAVEKQNQ